LFCKGKTPAEGVPQEFLGNQSLVFDFNEGNFDAGISLNNEAISLVAFYKEKDAYVVRLVNNNDHSENVCVKVMGQEYPLTFNKYEAKTYIFDGQSLLEKEIWY
jgi:hypothetical protein